MPMLVAMEHKTIHAAIKQAGDDGSFEAVVATLGVVDHQGDVIERGAFRGHPIPILPSHDANHVPLGKAQIVERGDQAIAEGQFNLDIEAARNWHSSLKFDLTKVQPAVQEWSWGFTVKGQDAKRDTLDGRPIRRLLKLDERELSPVLRGASIGSGTLSVKRLKASGRSDNDRRELLEAALGDVEKAPEFLWVEAVFDDVVVYTMRRDEEPSKTFERDYTLADGAADLGKERREVVREVSYRATGKGDSDPPAIKLADEIRWVMGDVGGVVQRVLEVAARRKADGRSMGEPVSMAALEMADECRELDRLMKGLRDIAVDVIPADETSQAAARFLRSEATLQGV